MVLGFGIGIWRDLSERVFRSVQQVESLLRTNCIALVPVADQKSSDAGRVLLAEQLVRSLSFATRSPSSNPLAVERGSSLQKSLGAALVWLAEQLARSPSFATRSPSSKSSDVERWSSLTLAPDINGLDEATKSPASE